MRVVEDYVGKASRPIFFEELTLMLRRYQIMLEETPDRYTVEEFVVQEHYRRDLFPKQ